MWHWSGYSKPDVTLVRCLRGADTRRQRHNRRMRRRRRHGTLGRPGELMRQGDVAGLREWAISDLGGDVYDFLWQVDNTWPHQGPRSVARLQEEDFTFAAEMLEHPLDLWSWLAQRPGSVGAEAERFASATRSLLDQIADRDGEAAVHRARLLWAMLREVGYEPKIIGACD
jgi:hypothetical protein